MSLRWGGLHTGMGLNNVGETKSAFMQSPQDPVGKKRMPSWRGRDMGYSLSSIQKGSGTHRQLSSRGGFIPMVHQSPRKQSFMSGKSSSSTCIIHFQPTAKRARGRMCSQSLPSAVLKRQTPCLAGWLESSPHCETSQAEAGSRITVSTTRCLCVAAQAFN